MIKQFSVTYRGGFGEWGERADAFSYQGFDHPTDPKDPSLYYFEISIFDDGT